MSWFLARMSRAVRSSADQRLQLLEATVSDLAAALASAERRMCETRKLFERGTSLAWGRCGAELQKLKSENDTSVSLQQEVDALRKEVHTSVSLQQEVDALRKESCSEKKEQRDLISQCQQELASLEATSESFRFECEERTEAARAEFRAELDEMKSVLISSKNEGKAETDARLLSLRMELAEAFQQDTESLKMRLDAVETALPDQSSMIQKMEADITTNISTTHDQLKSALVEAARLSEENVRKEGERIYEKLEGETAQRRAEVVQRLSEQMGEVEMRCEAEISIRITKELERRLFGEDVDTAIRRRVHDGLAKFDADAGSAFETLAAEIKDVRQTTGEVASRLESLTASLTQEGALRESSLKSLEDFMRVDLLGQQENAVSEASERCFERCEAFIAEKTANVRKELSDVEARGKKELHRIEEKREVDMTSALDENETQLAHLARAMLILTQIIMGIENSQLSNYEQLADRLEKGWDEMKKKVGASCVLELVMRKGDFEIMRLFHQAQEQMEREVRDMKRNFPKN